MLLLIKQINYFKVQTVTNILEYTEIILVN